MERQIQLSALLLRLSLLKEQKTKLAVTNFKKSTEKYFDSYNKSMLKKIAKTS